MTLTGQPSGLGLARRLDDACQVILGQSPPGASYNTTGEGLPFFQGKAEFGALYPTVRQWTTEPRKIAEPGDILISVRAPVGPTNLAPLRCAIGRGLAALRPRDGVSTRYVLHAVRASAGELAALATGTTFPAITGSQLRSHEIALPPPGLQERIVDAIEAHLSRLDAGAQSLRRAWRNVQRMRAAILRSAVEGRLVAQDAASELARALMGRIGGAAGIPTTARLSWPARDLPTGWAFATLGELIPPGRGLFVDGDWVESKDQDPEGHVRLIQLADIGAGRFRDRSRRFLTENRAAALGCTYLAPGDVLIARMPDPLGRAVLFPGVGQPAVTAVDVCIVRVDPSLIDPGWLTLLLNSPQWLTQVRVFESGTTRKRISRKNLARIEFPLPPREEQTRITAEAERQFTLLDSLEASTVAGETRADSLRQAILAAAFAGRLISPDSPATVASEVGT